MLPEVFETRREFNKRFPGKIYVCSKCKKLTTNPYICKVCGNQSNKLFNEFNDNYRFIIKEESEKIVTIFKPVELPEKEEN